MRKRHTHFGVLQTASPSRSGVVCAVLVAAWVLVAASVLIACGNSEPGDGGSNPATAGAMTIPDPTATAGGSLAGAEPVAGSGATAGAESMGGAGATGGADSMGGAPMGGSGAAAAAAQAGVGGEGGAAAGAGAGGSGAVAGTGGVAGQAGNAGMGGAMDGAPDMLSQTGLFTERGADGELVLADGVRSYQPRYALWSDGSGKPRYVYLPPGSQIDTSDPDHWVIPMGMKLWKSFVSDGQLVETRMIERTGDGEDDFRFSTYFWETADATDAVKMDPEELLLNAAGTTHDIPNGQMCNRCHGALKDHALGFSALQLNHDLGGVNLETLMDEGWLTDPISLDIHMPGEDQLTQDALGYLHANCGNCHNDSPGLPEENVPQPQMLLRVSVNDQTLEDTGVYKTAINQRSTASSELALDYRIFGGDAEQSAVHFRMTLRFIEDQMPPIGTEVTDPDGLALIQDFIESLPPPSP